MPAPADNRCPLCRTVLWVPDAEAIAQQTCPRCGAELWALVGSRGPLFYLRQPGQSKVSFLAALAAPLHGVSTEEMENVLNSADSLDLVEMVIEIEEKLRSVPPP